MGAMEKRQRAPAAGSVGATGYDLGFDRPVM
jgi:hypothetical protein